MNNMNPIAPPVKLLKKLLAVRKQMESVRKSGYNKHQNYNYVTEADLIQSVKKLLDENGVLVFSSFEITDIRDVKKSDKEGKEIPNGVVTSVKTVHTFMDADSGESHSVMSAGQGHDSLGDKGVYKAVTGAFKYFLSKNFLIESDDDPENDGVTAKNEAPRTFNKPAITPAVKSETSAPTATEATTEAAPAANGAGFKRSGFSRPAKAEPKF